MHYLNQIYTAMLKKYIHALFCVTEKHSILDKGNSNITTSRPKLSKSQYKDTIIQQRKSKQHQIQYVFLVEKRHVESRDGQGGIATSVTTPSSINTTLFIDGRRKGSS